ncbi:hypothetical protein ELG72_27780 (plasmid) [Rhizobium leguminosarum]|uniref:hypothetical protein n=1 Tax=Rhizobium TaxID=379 RepID=UPI0010305D4E|nr:MULTISPECIES: hypothetical protein [Rhizobium]MBY5374639.1 hypothetical protein [Rhizobium leguminosarum]MBY5415930.1 hypothetical protein [Rhizobium leguminosarum]TBF25702.1 hypothetical protein ELG92_33290 [Rhizobium leguminosarum]TBF44658.1 hypothetical protein ELG91_32520 [Rhizobium leguminosarum]TBF45524.1 hypothetical protein ELG90_33555 [Rhizobium leguminosarum]
MVATPLRHSEKRRKPHEARVDTHMLYTSRDITVSALTAGSIHVNVSIDADPADIDKWRAIVESDVAITAQAKPKQIRDKVPRALREAMEAAFVDVFSNRFSGEIGKVVDAYRVMLRESLAKGTDSELQKALNRARLQEKILASTSMVDQPQACELLGLSGTNPSATMKRKEEKREILRFTIDGRVSYPLFQFDVEGRRIFPTMAKLIALKPETWSDFRLLHWLTRPHLDFETAPAEKLGAEDAEVIEAFKREVVPAEHG